MFLSLDEMERQAHARGSCTAQESTVVEGRDGGAKCLSRLHGNLRCTHWFRCFCSAEEPARDAPDWTQPCDAAQ